MLPISNPAKRILLYVGATYMGAFITDLAYISLGSKFSVAPQFTILLWGLARMYTPTVSVYLCVKLESRRFQDFVKKSLGSVSRRTILWYLLSPIIVYAAMGLYVALASFIGLFSLDSLVKVYSETANLPISEALSLIYISIASAYFASITVNAMFALGEELGWRSYLLSLLDGRLDFRSTFIIGIVWALWHTSAIALLRYSYPNLGVYGIPLYISLLIPINLAHLVVVKVSGSILPAASLHGALNALWNLTILTSTLDPIETEIYCGSGLTGIVSWIVVSTALYKIALHSSMLDLRKDPNPTS
ncbi:MAG: CPBP family intramembrane metalloprotease [Candidatus Bathyarchaeota archaeon]|nr:CPBP family intramembrane metalloprotease [Candidatus Bathyarchaeota archaeon]